MLPVEHSFQCSYCFEEEGRYLRILISMITSWERVPFCEAILSPHNIFSYVTALETMDDQALFSSDKGPRPPINSYGLVN